MTRVPHPGGDRNFEFRSQTARDPRHHVPRPRPARQPPRRTPLPTPCGPPPARTAETALRAPHRRALVGGTSDDSPSALNTFRIDSGSWIAASTLRGPPRRGHAERALDAFLGTSRHGKSRLPQHVCPYWAIGNFERYAEVVQRDLAAMGVKLASLEPKPRKKQKGSFVANVALGAGIVFVGGSILYTAVSLLRWLFAH